MPYYVYALQPDPKLCCFYGSFENYHDAEICEREKQSFDNSQGEAWVTLIYGENTTHALQKIKQIRREKGFSHS